MDESKFKRLFIVANPTHLVNIKNYINKYPNGKNYVILTITYFEGYEEFIKNARNERCLKIIMIFFIDQSKKGIGLYYDIFKKLHKTKTIKKDHKFFNEICFTNYNSWLQNYLVNQFRSKKLILISDGTAIFSIVDLRRNNRKIPFAGNKIFINMVLKLKPIKNLHYYSQVNIDVADYDSLEVFNFKASKSTNINPKKIYFVGSPLVELEYIKPENNLKYLQSLRENFKDYEIVYYAHRREGGKILKEYGFFDRVLLDSIPFEERLENELELPGMVISYLSSILINLPQVYQNINFYYIPLSEGDIPENSQFQSRYCKLQHNFERIRSDNFKKLNLDINN